MDFKGNYSGSLLLDTIPLSDPLITAESLAARHLPDALTLIGAAIIVLFYAILGSKIILWLGMPTKCCD